MKPILLLVSFLTITSVQAQPSFQDLNFDQANPVPGGFGATVASALPGWTVYLGDVQQTDVWWDHVSLGAAAVTLLGPTGGNYSIILTAGPLESGSSVNASILQSGLVPSGSQSLQFSLATSASQPTDAFSISMNGNLLSPIALGGGVYGVNISSYAGQTGTLEFTDLIGEPGIGLDSIAFSPTVVPESSPFILASLGSLILAVRRFWRRSAPIQLM